MGPQAAWYVRQIGRLLGALSEADLNRMMNVMVERRVSAHEPLFSAGDRTDAINILVQGRVKLFSVAENGKEVILDLLKSGDIVGETALVENGVRQISAVALEETMAVGLSRDDFEALMQVRPTLAAAVARILARRLLVVQQQLQRLISQSVSSRLAGLLQDEQRRQDNGAVVRLGLTHQEIAQLIGTSRETVTALLGRFGALGIIEHQRRSITILDGDLLQACAQGQLQVSPRQPLTRLKPVLTRAEYSA